MAELSDTVQDGFITRMGRRARSTAAGVALYVLAGCSGGGGGSGPTQPPPPPTPINATLRFTDYVPVSSAADGGREVSVRVRSPGGVEQNTDLGQTTFMNATTGDYCIVSGSHVKTHAGGSQCYNITGEGTTNLQAVRSDMGQFWSTGDAARYDPRSRRGAADRTAFSNADLNAINSGFDFAQSCAHSGNFSASLESLGNPQAVPTNYDFMIINGAGSTVGTTVRLPPGHIELRRKAAVEATRLMNVAGNYGGIYSGVMSCPADFSYATAALNAGAPK